MLFTRKIGKIFLGKVTPAQIVMACVLGGMLGFIPGFFLPGDVGGGFMQAPGLIFSLVLLVLVLNANLAVFGLVTLLAKLLSLAALPLTFQVGRFLLDGPTQGLFRGLINAPVLAWFGLEHYTTTGGIAVGFVTGLVFGLLLSTAVGVFRRRMATLEEGSEAYRKFAAKRWVKLLQWLLLGGGKGKKTYAELLERGKVGNPFRIAGVVVALIAVASVFVLQRFFAEPVLTQYMKSGLEQVNGATVDVGGAELDLAGGSMRVSDVAMADPNELGTDLFRAKTLLAAIDTKDLLRKRFVINSVKSSEATTGEKRLAPGRLTVKKPAPPTPPKEPGTRTIEDYIKEAEKWKERLDQAEEWFDAIFEKEEVETEESREERIEREASELGYARVAATHLIAEAPTVLLRALDLEGVRSVRLGGELLDIRGRNLSSHPSLVPEPPRLTVTSRSGNISFDAALPGGGSGVASLALGYKGLAVDDVAGQLSVGGAPPIQGGTLDLAASGTFSSRPEGVVLDLPLQVTLLDTVLRLSGAKETPVQSLTIPIGIRGPMRSPSVHLDDRALADALVAAGKAELASFVRSKLPGELQGLVDIDKKPAELVEEAKKKAEDEARKRIEEEAKKRLEGLPGIFGGKKK
jgi:uncharacterized protein (TIGR03546 family)